MAATETSATAGPTRFIHMSIGGKLAFLCKLVVFLCTFGFAYPRLLTD